MKDEKLAEPGQSKARQFKARGAERMENETADENLDMWALCKEARGSAN